MADDAASVTRTGISYHTKEELIAKITGGTVAEVKPLTQEQRGQGVGTQAMQDLIGYADEQGKTIALSPSADFGASSVDRLKDFYKRFGFVDNKGKGRDFEISESMYRRGGK